MPKEQYGTWTSGVDVTIPEMLDICLGSMESSGISIPPDKFGTTAFTLAFIQKPPIHKDDPHYLPGEDEDSTQNKGFTAIKLTYEVSERGNP